jgi:hypothetical protein
MRKRLRPWLWAGLFLLAAALSVSVWWGHQYCQLCGTTRDIVSLNPFGIGEGCGWVFSQRETETPLSKLAGPLLWPAPSHHQWVTQTDTCIAIEVLSIGHLGSHWRFDRQESVCTGDVGSFFEDTARADPELTRYLLRRVLSPNATPDEVLSGWSELTSPWVPQELDDLRAKYGLPASNRYVADLALSRVRGSGGLQLTMTLSNAGTEAIVVDKELVFGVSVEVVAGGKEVEDAFDVVRVFPKPEAGGMAARFVHLAPGESVRRTIDLSPSGRTNPAWPGASRWCVCALARDVTRSRSATTWPATAPGRRSPATPDWGGTSGTRLSGSASPR